MRASGPPRSRRTVRTVRRRTSRQSGARASVALARPGVARVFLYAFFMADSYGSTWVPPGRRMVDDRSADVRAAVDVASVQEVVVDEDDVAGAAERGFHEVGDLLLEEVAVGGVERRRALLGRDVLAVCDERVDRVRQIGSRVRGGGASARGSCAGAIPPTRVARI